MSNKTCEFPDGTVIELHSILDVTETHSYICYYWENILQTVWVPNTFLK
jgi:hypothetical protein